MKNIPKTITIDPVTRIEGHSKITLHLDDQGVVENARFHVTQFRGFEKLCEGRPFYEMPRITSRTCGICPVAHLVASSKACDDLYSVQIPPTAQMLRRMMNLAQVIQSHALNFFYLCLPDLVLGMDSAPEKRHFLNLLSENPDFARDGIRLRQFGQQIIEWLGGKRIHPAWVVPGGVSEPLTTEHRDNIASALPDAKAIAVKTLERYKKLQSGFVAETRTFGNFPSIFMGLVDEEGNLEHYDGSLRVMDSAGNIIVKGLNTLRYEEIVGEAVEPWTYMKFPYFKPIGYPQGLYRVGPLARLNIINRCGTETADRELDEFRDQAGYPALSSFHYHWARLIEIIFGIERIEQILNEPGIMDKHVRAWALPNSFNGVGVAEAPRGTLIHHYKIDEQGLITTANLIIATGHNNLAMNRSILQVARAFVDGNQLKEGMLNRVEAVIRAYDPCLSCSTHAAGQMPLVIQLMTPTGEVVDELKRN